MRLLLFILCIAEVLLYTYCSNIAGPVFSPVIIIAVALSIAFLSLKLSNAPQKPSAAISRRTQVWIKIASVAIFTGLAIWVVAILNDGFHIASMFDTSFSDIMVTHRHMVKNFMSDKPTYEPFFNINYYATPAYLPFQWMPDLIAEWLHFDYRWVAVASMLAASVFFLLKNIGTNNTQNLLLKIIVPVWPLVIYTVLVKTDTFEFLITMESLVAGYYLLLATTLDKSKWILIAVALAVCMLSRMSIALWVPLCILCYFIYGERKKAFIIAGLCALFVLVFYCPFMINNPILRHSPYQAYLAATRDIWNGNGLMNGLSFNTWGMKYLTGTTEHKVTVYGNIQLIVCALVVAGLVLYFFKARKKYSLNSYLLFSLKIYIAVFYTLIQLPFTYLFIIPLIITPALLSHAVLPRHAPKSS